MKRYLSFVGLVAFAAATAAVALAEEKAAPKAVVMPAPDLKWNASPVLNGAKFAVLWGDPTKGAYGMLRSLPAGSTLGLHSHTASQRVVGISGTIEFNLEGEAKKDLGAGSYIAIPGGAVHDATCKAGADCVYFEEATGASDFKPAAKK